MEQIFDTKIKFKEIADEMELGNNNAYKLYKTVLLRNDKKNKEDNNNKNKFNPAINPNRINQMKIDEGYPKPQIDIISTNKVRKSVCKILIKRKEGIQAGTAFFLLYQKKKYLITCHHVINSEINKFDVEIWDQRVFTFELKGHNIIQLEEPIDIIIIEMKNSDEINDYIECLDYDLNYSGGCAQYKNIDIFSIGYPKGLNSTEEAGKIEKINDFEFYHNINTEKGSSGSPVVLFNTLKVIGVHK